jgi:acetyl esterase/lipase
VVAKGKDDPRLVALAQTLARLRFAVFVPDLKGLRQLRVRASDVREVADGFRYLVSRTDLVSPGRVGIAGFSYGAAPVVLAALETDIRDQVTFIVTLGGFHDAQSITTYFTTGYYRDETTGEWRHLEQSLYGVLVFAQSYVGLATRAEDRERLTRYIDELAAERGIATMKMLPGLAPDAQALQALLINRDPERVPALIAQLSPRMRREMDGLNPAARDLRQLEAKMILIHGRGDNIIPYTESVMCPCCCRRWSPCFRGGEGND